MQDNISSFFAEDHRRLALLLDRAIDQRGNIDETAYSEFRSGLLRHIALEEKILLPEVQKANSGKAYPLAARLRLEHGAIVALLVLPPAASVKNVLLGILEQHNTCEECVPGLYHDCDVLLSESTERITKKVQEYPDVPMMPYNNSQIAWDAAHRAVARAGYDFDALTNSHKRERP